MNKTAAEELIPLAKEIHLALQKAGAYDQVMDFLRLKNSYPVLFLGASGAGKTAFLKSLSNLPAHVRREDRTDEVQSVKQKLGNFYIEVFDTPGETEHKSKREILFREMAARKSIGVVNIVSYGFHEGKVPQSVAIDGNKPAEIFLEQRRQIEIELIKEWIGPMCGRGGCVSWILTVVTKADLWWQAGIDQPVLDYYNGERYKTAFAAGDDTPKIAKPYSSLNHLFYDKAPMSGFYSDLRRNEDHVAIITHILQKASAHG